MCAGPSPQENYTNIWRLESERAPQGWTLCREYVLFATLCLCLLVETSEKSNADYNLFVDLSQHLVHNHNDMEDLINLGNANRTTASTGMNGVSSRSHGIFTIRFTQVSCLSASLLSLVVSLKVFLQTLWVFVKVIP